MSIQVDNNIWKNELLTVKEVANYLRVGRVTIWRWCQQGIIPAIRMGRSWRIHRDDLVNFLQKEGSPLSKPLVDEADGQVTCDSNAEQIDESSITRVDRDQTSVPDTS